MPAREMWLDRLPSCSFALRVGSCVRCEKMNGHGAGVIGWRIRGKEGRTAQQCALDWLVVLTLHRSVRKNIH